MLINIPKENISFQNSSKDEQKILIENKLKSFLNNASILDEIIFIDKDGFVTASSNHIPENIDVKDKDYFKEIKSNNNITKGFSSAFYFYIRKHHKRELFLINELQRSKAKFENMFRIHSAVMLLIDPKNGKIVDANNSALDFYQYSLDEIKNLNISKINIGLNDEIKKAQSLDKNIFHFRHKLKNGEIKIVEVNSSPIKTKDGIVLFSIIKDITKEKTTEEKLQKSYELQKKLINLQENIIILTNGKALDFVNNKFLSFFGYESLEAFKKDHSCICNFFKEGKDMFSLSKIKNKDFWIEELEEKDDLDKL